MDGNVLRVVSRVLASREDITRQAVKRRTEELIRSVMPAGQAGDYNQALIETGALVCVPNGAPKCGECPLESLCLAAREGLTEEIPVKAAKKARKQEKKTVFIIEAGDLVAIRKRPEEGLLASLYELPMMEGAADEKAAAEHFRIPEELVESVQALPEAKHIFSHVEWHMTGYAIRVEELEHTENSGFLFVEPEKTEKEYPIPAAFAAYTEYLNIRLGVKKDGLENE